MTSRVGKTFPVKGGLGRILEGPTSVSAVGGTTIVSNSSEALLDRQSTSKLKQAPPLQGAGVAPRREAPGRAVGDNQKFADVAKRSVSKPGPQAKPTEGFDVVLRRCDIEKAKELLKGEWRGFAGTELFLHLVHDHQEWFYERFPVNGDEDHHAYTDAVLSYAQTEMFGNGSLFERRDDMDDLL